MEFLKKAIIEPGTTLNLSSLIENYIIEGVSSPSPEILGCLTEAVVRTCPLKKVLSKIS